MMKRMNSFWYDVEFEDHVEDEKNIPEAVRIEVLDRDKWRCRRCGTEDQLTLHHIVYRSRGGRHNPENLITLCFNDHEQVHKYRLFFRRINDTWFFKEV